MKYFKRIALLIVAAVSAVCVGIFAAACDGDNGDKEVKEFTATVYYSDGETTVDGTGENLMIQICIETEAISFCSTNVYNVDANGQAKINIAKVNAEVDALTNENGDDPIPDSEKVYVLHVLKAGAGQLKLTQEVHVSKANPDVKIVLSEVTAP